jgi:Zn-dependent protease
MALLFFAALVAYEQAHAVVAQAQGLRVRSITLFALGGGGYRAVTLREKK